MKRRSVVQAVVLVGLFAVAGCRNARPPARNTNPGGYHICLGNAPLTSRDPSPTDGDAPSNNARANRTAES
jgi:hypothetical protein